MHGAADKRSLKLPPGASATSPVMCVGIHEPVVRRFARNTLEYIREQEAREREDKFVLRKVIG